MSGDYSRKRFNPEKHYQGVLRQQGTGRSRCRLERVYRSCRTAAGAPRPSMSSAAAACRRKLRTDSRSQVAGGQLTVGQGRIYVDGFLAENHGANLLFNAALEETYGTARCRWTISPTAPVRWCSPRQCARWCTGCMAARSHSFAGTGFDRAGSQRRYHDPQSDRVAGQAAV